MTDVTEPDIPLLEDYDSSDVERVLDHLRDNPHDGIIELVKWFQSTVVETTTRRTSLYRAVSAVQGARTRLGCYHTAVAPMESAVLHHH